MLVDVEARRPVDILPERSADSFAAWLAQRPGTQVISRDRASVYSDGAAAAARPKRSKSQTNGTCGSAPRGAV